MAAKQSERAAWGGHLGLRSGFPTSEVSAGTNPGLGALDPPLGPCATQLNLEVRSGEFLLLYAVFSCPLFCASSALVSFSN